jgi:branched-subunit amino acid ABC-type transport system permease component
MQPLTPNERQRIYEEEKVRVEAQEHAKTEIAYAQPFSWGKFLFLAVILGVVSFFPLMLLYVLFVAPMLGIKDPSPGGAMVFAFIVGCLAARLFYRPVQRPL